LEKGCKNVFVESRENIVDELENVFNNPCYKRPKSVADFCNK
jgi:hypothetical protein